MPNVLTRGTRRIGDFIDGDANTPEVKVTLERSDQGIGINISWSSPDSPYAGWFLGSHRLEIGAGGQPKTITPLPKRVIFHDSHGPVLLIRCWTQGFHANALGPGSGNLWAHAAVLGVGELKEFDRPHGLQTEISGLREWLGITSWAEEDRWLEGRTEYTLKSKAQPSIVTGAHSGVALEFRPGWGLKPAGADDERVLMDLLRCTTVSATPLDWEDHLQVHRAIRDLLVVSRWWDESVVEVRAHRDDDPLTTMDGATHGDQWREVVVVNDERKPPPKGYRQHLITYPELGVTGLQSWLKLRDEFARAFDPVISSIDLRNTTAHTRLAHTGPGLEALGYLLMVRDGISEKKAAQSSLRERLERILMDLGTCLPFDGPTWVDRTVAVYNGIKHANRQAPDYVDVANTWRESVLAVRAWIAIELGVPVADVESRLGHDPQSAPLVRRSS